MRLSRLFIAALAVLAATACSDITAPDSKDAQSYPIMGSGGGG